MAPPSSASNSAGHRAAAAVQQQQDADARSPALKDWNWKELIDNGLAGGGGGGQRSPGRQNRTSATEDPSATRASGSANSLIPLYCGLLGALICGLVLWIVLKHARGRARRESKLKSHPAAAAAAAFAGGAGAPLAPGRPEEEDADDGECGGDCGGGGDERRRLVDLPEARMKRLEQMLDSGSGWKTLAAQMGYQADVIEEFESRAKLESASPARLLLHNWGSAPAGSAAVATVAELRRRLLAAGLADALTCPRGGSAEQRKRRQRPAAAPPTTAEGRQLQGLTAV